MKATHYICTCLPSEPWCDGDTLQQGAWNHPGCGAASDCGATGSHWWSAGESHLRAQLDQWRCTGRACSNLFLLLRTNTEIFSIQAMCSQWTIPAYKILISLFTSKRMFWTISAVDGWLDNYGRLVLVSNTKIIQMHMAGFVISSVARLPFLCAAVLLVLENR